MLDFFQISEFTHYINAYLLFILYFIFYFILYMFVVTSIFGYGNFSATSHMKISVSDILYDKLTIIHIIEILFLTIYTILLTLDKDL